MGFLAVVVGAQLLDQRVGWLDLADAFRAKERGEAVLPVVVQAFHLPLGLRCGGCAGEGHCGWRAPPLL